MSTSMALWMEGPHSGRGPLGVRPLEAVFSVLQLEKQAAKLQKSSRDSVPNRFIM